MHNTTTSTVISVSSPKINTYALLLLALIGLGLLGWRMIWVFGFLAVVGAPLFYWMRDNK
jgi:hypothetical protein